MTNRIGAFITLSLLLTLSGYWIAPQKTVYETEYFRYQNYGWQNFGQGVSEKVEIIGLTDLGKQQEALVIPEFIDNKPVSLIGISAGWGPPGDPDFENMMLRKIFLENSGVPVSGNFLSDCLSLEKVFCTLHDDSYFHSNGIYINLLGYDNRRSFLEIETFDREGRNISETLSPANISYHYNYENADNYGIHWIDDQDYGDRIKFVPPVPIREGYEFVGWYQEPEAINQWDFVNDRLPELMLDENEEIVFQETKLYAKWLAL